MSLTKALNLFGGEKPIVTRERMRQQYTGFEYLISKSLAELPLDTFFSLVFVAVLKLSTGVNCSLSTLTQTFAMSTVSSASLGFAVGSFTNDKESALVVGIPLMVIFMAVGVINPAGVDVNEPPPILVQWLKRASPIKWVIEALCISEFKGMKFGKTKKGRFWGLPRMGAFAAVRNGDQVLDAIGLSEVSYSSVIKSIAKLSGINLCIALAGLIHTRTNFVEAQPLDTSEIDNFERVGSSQNRTQFTYSNTHTDTNENMNQMKPVTVTGTYL